MAIEAHAVRPELEHASGAGGPLGDSRSVQPLVMLARNQEMRPYTALPVRTTRLRFPKWTRLRSWNKAAPPHSFQDIVNSPQCPSDRLCPDAHRGHCHDCRTGLR